MNAQYVSFTPDQRANCLALAHGVSGLSCIVADTCDTLPRLAHDFGNYVPADCHMTSFELYENAKVNIYVRANGTNHACGFIRVR